MTAGARTDAVTDVATQLASWRHRPTSTVERDAITARLVDSVLCAAAAEHAAVGPARRVRSYVEETAGAGPATDWTTGRALDPASAALVNGTAVRALDLNDTHVARGITHPSDAVAAIVAVGESAASTHDEVVGAITITYDVVCRLNEVADLRSHGMEAATLIGIGVAVGGSLLLDLDDDATANAVRLAAVMTPALRCTRSGRLSDWKAVASPRAAVEGVRALGMARHSITPPPAIFTDDDGFAGRVTGPLELLLDPALRVVNTLLKLEPAQVFIQDPLRAARMALRDAGAAGADVEGVEVVTFERCRALVGGALPLTADGTIDPASADHSLQVCIAAGLLHGRLGPATFALAASDPAVRRLAEAVVVEVESDVSTQPRAHSEVRVNLRDGRRVSVATASLPPITPADLGPKFDGDVLNEWPSTWPWQLRGAPPFPQPSGVPDRSADADDRTAPSRSSHQTGDTP